MLNDILISCPLLISKQWLAFHITSVPSPAAFFHTNLLFSTKLGLSPQHSYFDPLLNIVTSFPFTTTSFMDPSSSVYGSEFSAGDISFVLTSMALVWLMIPGIGYFYSGMARSKNALSLIMCCVLSLVVVTLQVRTKPSLWSIIISSSFFIIIVVYMGIQSHFQQDG